MTDFEFFDRLLQLFFHSWCKICSQLLLSRRVSILGAGNIQPEIKKFNFRDLIQFVMCARVSRVHMTFHILTKRYTVPGNQGTHEKLNQIQFSGIQNLYLDK